MRMRTVNYFYLSIIIDGKNKEKRSREQVTVFVDGYSLSKFVVEI
jgi:hypothetical protein